MKKGIILTVVFLSVLCAGCVARAHPGKYALESDGGPNAKFTKPEKGMKPDSDLIVSGREIRELASKYFGVVDFTFENTTGQWINVTDIGLDFGNDTVNKSVEIPLGDKIALWAKAVKARVKATKIQPTVLTPLSVILSTNQAASFDVSAHSSM